MTLQEAIQRLANAGKTYPILCEVKAIEGATVDVEPLNEPEFFGVRVNAEITGSHGVKVIPKIGAKVFILPINREIGIVVLASELIVWGLKASKKVIDF